MTLSSTETNPSIYSNKIQKEKQFSDIIGKPVLNKSQFVVIPVIIILSYPETLKLYDKTTETEITKL